VLAVIFDWGGTLSEWADVDLVYMWRLAARHIDPHREAELTAPLVAVEARSWERVRTDQRSARLVDLLAEASTELGVDVFAAVLDQAAAGHLDSWTPHIRHHQDAAATLRRLRRTGLRIGLLSNTHCPRHFHERVLERDGLAELIDARLYTSEMEFVKPHPSAFNAALGAVGVDDPSEAVFVGDRLHDEIFGAKSAGLRAVWVRNDRNPGAGDGPGAEPDGVIDRLADLPGVLDGLP
jgi:putative hydrolase of the HAD superfamily